MPTFGLENKKIMPVATVTAGIFLCFSILFFLPADIPHKITVPLTVLFIGSLWLCPWQMSAALLFSALGDYMGSCGNFLGQMGFFAAGHIFYIVYFTARYRQVAAQGYNAGTNNSGACGRLYMPACAAVTAALLAFVMWTIVPQAFAKDGAVIGSGTGIYACLICLMLVTALMQKKFIFAAGAILFVFSDFMLAWNKFISPVPYRNYVVLVPYFAAQFLMFAGAAGKGFGKELRHDIGAFRKRT